VEQLEAQRVKAERLNGAAQELLDVCKDVIRKVKHIPTDRINEFWTHEDLSCDLTPELERMAAVISKVDGDA